MSYVDKTLVCGDCQAEFVHSAVEQERWAGRGFTQEPKRCSTCRAKRRAAGGGGPPGGNRRGGGGPGRDGGGPRQFHPATCASCGKATTVPFKPTEGRPVYCRECYGANQGQRRA